MDELDVRTDENTEQLAAELYKQVSELNHSIQVRPGLKRPETAYTVLGRDGRRPGGVGYRTGQDRLADLHRGGTVQRGRTDLLPHFQRPPAPKPPREP